MAEPAGRFHIGLGEAAGAIADLGVMVPLAAALILVNGLNATAVLLGAGLLVIVSGVAFGIPFPVQPLKALTAVAVAERLAPEVIHAAGLEIAAFLLLLSVGRVADVVARIFTRPVVRGLQVGVGVLLVATSARLVASPPEVFAGTPPPPWPIVLGVAGLVVVALTARSGRHGLALAMLAAGVVATWVAGGPEIGLPDPSLPSVGFPSAAAFGSAFFLLVVPQMPLTFGNAVVAVTDVARREFGARAGSVTPWRVCLSCGAGNVVSAFIGGMPMCHGAGGLTAHVRLGARTAGMNLLLGTSLIAVGVMFGTRVPALLGLLPVWVLAAFLAYAGIRHALLAADLRGAELAVAVLAGVVGAALSNLAYTAVIGLVMDHGPRARRRVTRGGTATGATTAAD